MQPMLKKKIVWNIIDNSRSKSTTARQITKKDKNYIIITKIIKQGVSFDFYISVIGI